VKLGLCAVVSLYGFRRELLSWALPTPPCLKRGSDVISPSLPSLPLKPSYSQIVKTKIPPCDPKKETHDPRRVLHDLSCDTSRDPPVLSRSHDQAHDQMRSHVQT